MSKAHFPFPFQSTDIIKELLNINPFSLAQLSYSFGPFDYIFDIHERLVSLLQWTLKCSQKCNKMKIPFIISTASCAVTKKRDNPSSHYHNNFSPHFFFFSKLPQYCFSMMTFSNGITIVVYSSK